MTIRAAYARYLGLYQVNNLVNQTPILGGSEFGPRRAMTNFGRSGELTELSGRVLLSSAV